MCLETCDTINIPNSIISHRNRNTKIRGSITRRCTWLGSLFDPKPTKIKAQHINDSSTRVCHRSKQRILGRPPPTDEPRHGSFRSSSRSLTPRRPPPPPPTRSVHAPHVHRCSRMQYPVSVCVRNFFYFIYSNILKNNIFKVLHVYIYTPLKNVILENILLMTWHVTIARMLTATWRRTDYFVDNLLTILLELGCTTVITRATS